MEVEEEFKCASEEVGGPDAWRTERPLSFIFSSVLFPCVRWEGRRRLGSPTLTAGNGLLGENCRSGTGFWENCAEK